MNLSPNALAILEDRYLQNGETPEDLFRRVAGHVAEGEIGAYKPSSPTENEEPIVVARRMTQEWKEKFYNLMTSLKFLPNSPTLVNAGTGKGCLSACFVMSPEDTMESIMEVAYDAAMTEKWGGGIGFGLSKLRAKGDPIRTVHGRACGPVAVMRLYSKIGDTLTQGSFRMGAHMGQMHITHPDIREFIHCKDDDDSLSNFNISVQVTDEVMQRIDKLYDLPSMEGTGGIFKLWSEICESAWKTGDPGVVFMDRVLESQPNPILGDIQTSNPCGEEFLENYGNCCLGSINLAAHVDYRIPVGPNTGYVDFQALRETIQTAVRFLDDVIEVNVFPVKKQREINLATRRIGLGVMGWADTLVMLEIPYDSPEALKLAREIASFIQATALDASHELANERGPFPKFAQSRWSKMGHGMLRHSSVTTIAPTGSISRIADCSSGIEPHYNLAYWSNILWKDQEEASQKHLDIPKPIRYFDGKVLYDDIAKGNTTALFEMKKKYPFLRTAHDISPEWHVRMQAAWQKHTTNSVSKTINLPNNATIDDVSQAFILAWKEGCKAVTIYRDGSKDKQVLETTRPEPPDPEPKDSTYGISLEQIKEAVESPSKMPRPRNVAGNTERFRTGHGNVYITVNRVEDKPFEVFAGLGKTGECDGANTGAITRLISLALRSGVPVEEIVDQLEGLTCHPHWDDGVLVKSVPDAIAKSLLGDKLYRVEDAAKAVESIINAPRCPKCDGALIQRSGCEECLDCGYNSCG